MWCRSHVSGRAKILEVASLDGSRHACWMLVSRLCEGAVVKEVVAPKSCPHKPRLIRTISISGDCTMSSHRRTADSFWSAGSPGLRI